MFRRTSKYSASDHKFCKISSCLGLKVPKSKLILLTVGYRPFPPSFWGKATTFVEILWIVVILVMAVSGLHIPRGVREVCGYVVATLLMTSGLHYSIVVAGQLHSEH